MGYSYLSDFPQASRARIKAVEIQAGLELENSKQQLNRLSDFETEVRKYILAVFSAFAEEALALGQRGSWTVEIIDREAREFLASITLQTQLEKGHDRRGHSIRPLTNHVFGHILPEVRGELVQSSVWRRYQEQLAEVARLQASSSAEQPLKISREKGQAAVSRGRKSRTGAQKASTHAARPEMGSPAAIGKETLLRRNEQLACDDERHDADPGRSRLRETKAVRPRGFPANMAKHEAIAQIVTAQYPNWAASKGWTKRSILKKICAALDEANLADESGLYTTPDN